MYKIIKIDGDTIFVGKQSGEFTQIPKSNFAFEPKVGDIVEIFQNGDEFIVSKSNNISQFTGAKMGFATGTKTKLIAGLLALFLGYFGLYDFYIGNNKMGIIRLVITLIGLLLLPDLIALINTVWNIIVAVLVFTSKPGSKWHQAANGMELQD